MKQLVHTGLLAGSLALVGQVNAVENPGLDLIETVQVAVPPQVLPALRVGDDGFLYVLDRSTGRVAAFSPDGTKRWETPDPKSNADFIVQFDLMKGRRLRVVTAEGEVATLDGRGRRINAATPQSGGPRQAPSPIAAVDDGGFYVVASSGESAVHHFDKDGALVRSFGTRSSTTQLVKHGAFLSWLRRGPDGSIYYRSEPELVFHRFSTDGSSIVTIRPVGVPYRPRTPTNKPGDTVFGTDVLSDGRIVFEVVHRTPYTASGLSAEGPVASTFLDVKLYVVDQDGRVRVLRPPPSELGAFAAVGPNDDLYFMRTAEMLKPGEGTTIQRVRASLK